MKLVLSLLLLKELGDDSVSKQRNHQCITYKGKQQLTVNTTIQTTLYDYILSTIITTRHQDLQDN